MFVQGGSPTPHPFPDLILYVKFSRQRSTFADYHTILSL